MRFLRILISIVVLLLLNPLEVFADTIDNIELTDIEKQWIAEEHIVKVRVSYYPPFQFNQQKLEGLSVDIIKHIFNENNIKYELVSGAGHPWSESLELIKNRKNFDLLLTASISEERKSFLTFSDKYLQLPWVIFTRNDTQSITTIDDLKDKIVSTPEAFLIKTLLEEQYPKINLKTFGGGIIVLSAEAPESIKLYFKNKSDATDFTVKHAQVIITEMKQADSGTYGELYYNTGVTHQPKPTGQDIKKVWTTLTTFNQTQNLSNINSGTNSLVIQEDGFYLVSLSMSFWGDEDSNYMLESLLMDQHQLKVS